MQELELVKAEALHAYQTQAASDFLLFAKGLKIPTSQGPQRFFSCMESFQLRTFETIAPSLQALQIGEIPKRRRFWIERTKKAGKDSDLAICLLWLLAYPQRPLYLQVGAADRDQAAIVRRRMKDLLHYNPWLQDRVSVQQYRAISTTGLSEVDIVAADIAGSHGEAPDLLIVNELSHVTKWEFVENLLDNASGVPHGVVILATNAGFRGTKAEVWRNNAIGSPDWNIFIWDQPAPWVDPKDVEDAKRRDSPSRYRRLWWGQWASGKGDALSEDAIERCFASGVGPLDAPEPGWTYLMGMDLGVRHDHAGLVVVGVHYGEQKIRLARMHAWEPGAAGEVDLSAVEDSCLCLSRLFNVSWVGYDPTEARLMAQRLRRQGVPMQEVSFSVPSNLTLMANSLVQAVESGKLQLFDDDDGRLRRDLGKFNIVEKPYGYKLEAVSDQFGHADVGTALAICLPKALRMLEIGWGLEGEEIAWRADKDAELTEEEIKGLPAELAEIYETYNVLEEKERRKRAWDDEWWESGWDKEELY